MYHMKTDSTPTRGIELTKADIALWRRFARTNGQSLSEPTCALI
jgi:hypothetical protein